jgi:hypothetical protein
MSASIWNTDIVNNLAYLKDAPTFDGAVAVTGVLTVNGSGTSTFSAASASGQILSLVNTTGTDFARGQILAGAGGTNADLYLTAWGRANNGIYLQGAAVWETSTSGGVSIAATHGSGAMRFYTGGTTARMTIASGGDFDFASSKITFQTNGVPTRINIFARANGTGSATGNAILIGRNSSGSGAPGLLQLEDKAGTSYWLWVDSLGKLRISSAGPPEEDGAPSDTSGTVVGTQS